MYLDRMYDVGICEQHFFAFVQGLILSGQLPVLAHYSTFAQRGFDQFFQEVVVQRDLGVPLVLDRAGLVGEDGETHQGLYIFHGAEPSGSGSACRRTVLN